MFPKRFHAVVTEQGDVHLKWVRPRHVATTISLERWHEENSKESRQSLRTAFCLGAMGARSLVDERARLVSGGAGTAQHEHVDPLRRSHARRARTPPRPTAGRPGVTPTESSTWPAAVFAQMAGAGGILGYRKEIDRIEGAFEVILISEPAGRSCSSKS